MADRIHRAQYHRGKSYPKKESSETTEVRGKGKKKKKDNNNIQKEQAEKKTNKKSKPWSSHKTGMSMFH